jgi:hypothetical protein
MLQLMFWEYDCTQDINPTPIWKWIILGLKNLHYISKIKFDNPIQKTLTKINKTSTMMSHFLDFLIGVTTNLSSLSSRYWGGQNNGSTKKLRNSIYVGYTERTSVGITGCSSVYLQSVVLVQCICDSVE